MQPNKKAHSNRNTTIPVPIFIFHDNLPEKRTTPLGIERNGATCKNLAFPTLGNYIEQSKINEFMIYRTLGNDTMHRSAINDITRLTLFRGLQLRIPHILRSTIEDKRTFTIQKDIQLAKIKCTLMAAGLTTLIKNSFPEFSSQKRGQISAILHKKSDVLDIYNALFAIKQQLLRQSLLKAMQKKWPLSYMSEKRVKLAYTELAKKSIRALPIELLEQLFVLPDAARDKQMQKIADNFRRCYDMTTSFVDISELTNDLIPSQDIADIGWSINQKSKKIEISIQSATPTEGMSKLRTHILRDKFLELEQTLCKCQMSGSIDFPERQEANAGIIKLII